MPERPKNIHAESDTMLDKSLPYKSIIMRMEAAVAERLAPPAPAAGYRICPFVPGNERHWARIETSVGEFPDEAAARAYFERVYLPEAALQCLFVVTEQDEPVATATTWTEEEASLRQLQLQWVAVEPAHQGRGLGRAIATAAVRRAVRLAPGEAILLHTQTWSHRALRLYRSLGFRFCRTQTIVMRSKEGTGMKRYPNEFEEAMEVLRRTVAPAEIDEWRRTAFR